MRRRVLLAFCAALSVLATVGFCVLLVKRDVDLRLETSRDVGDAIRTLKYVDAAVRAVAHGSDATNISLEMAEAASSAALARVERLHADGRLSAESMRIAAGGKARADGIGEELRHSIRLFLSGAPGGRSASVVAASMRVSSLLEQILAAERNALDRNLRKWSVTLWAGVAEIILGALAGFAFIYLPIERRILAVQAQQLQRRDDAESLAEAKSNFLSMISHEVRTPMNGVLGMTGLLLDTKVSAAQRKMLGVIDRSSRALVAMVDDVLTLARMEDRGVELASEPFDLASCVEDVAALFRSVAEAKGLALTVEIEPGLELKRIGDEGRLRQVLSNLVSNAVKFSESGEVRVAVGADGRPDDLLFKVSDEGRGVSQDAQQRIFDRFEQGEADTARRFGGSGLGLSIVKGLVDAMGGEVKLVSKLGEGSEFSVALALRCANQPGSRNPVAMRETRGDDDERLHVLVAEDNMINQIVVREMLQPEGCVVEIVETGAEALKRALEFGFDLILMDLQMPVMGGIEAARRIAEEETRRGMTLTPIVALTANAMAENRRQAREVGMQGFIAKPIDLQTLRGVLAQFACRTSQDDARRAG